jgi:hypothetical protein
MRNELALLAIPVIVLGAPLLLEAGVIETKSLTRQEDPVVVTGAKTSGFVGLAVNNADATQAPNQIFAWAYDGSGAGWRQVVFQIDEVNNSYPASPPPICTSGSHVGLGPNHMEADDGLWDSNDELVFMSGEAGDRVSQDLWPAGASTSAPRYEITLTDPLDTSKKGWVYIFRHDTLPTWPSTDYVSWNETTNTVTNTLYSVDYPDSHTSAAYFTNLNVTAAGGGTGANMVQKSKLYWYGGFAAACGSAETAIRTEQTITGGSCSTMVLPWYAKDGRVRVLRYYIWSPYCTWVSNGIGMWPCNHVYYYKSFWREDSNVKFHGGSGHTDYWWGSVNHANTTTMTFYDSNGESCAIDGTTETMANTPLWTWYQVSSAYGSYVQVLRDTAKQVSPDSRRNLYTDSGTGQRGDAGYRIENPSETTEDAWHQFYFFFLPANAPNQGATYNSQVDNQLTLVAVSQSSATPPAFAGISSATDVNGACADEGVAIGWTAVVNWNDGCSASCTLRRYEVSRNGTVIRTESNVAATSWVDTTGVNGTAYNYGVEACNQLGTCTQLGNTLSARDYSATAPTLSSSATAVTDLSACLGDGVSVAWSAPSDWKDAGEGSRGFDLFWDADGFAAPIATNVSSPVTYDAPDGVSRSYRIRATNGCGLSTNYSASSAAVDAIGQNPTLPSPGDTLVADLAACSFSGLQVAWSGIAAWGDGGAGSRRYDLYWSGDGYASPLVANATSPTLVAPPDSALYGFRVRAINGCGLSADYAIGSGSDSQTAPAFAGVQTATDSNLCNASALTITWTDIDGAGPSGWNDGGSGAGNRAYRIYRDGGEIAGSPKIDGISSTTDTPPSPNVAYVYTVRAYNGLGCYTAGGASVSGTDAAGIAPVASPAATTAADIACSAGSGVAVSWDLPTDWGDNGSGISSRRFLLYWSANGYSSPIASYAATATAATYFPPVETGYRYRVVARNGCLKTRIYTESGWAIDRTSCAPSCTLKTNVTFDAGADGFAQSCNGGKSIWALTAGVGNGGTQAWRANLEGGGLKNAAASLELQAAVALTWTTDVKLRFWATTALASDDAGIVEVWTDDSNIWRKLQVIAYPSSEANVPGSITLNCASDAIAGPQPAFQGSVPGAHFEGKLDSLLTGSTQNIKVRFKAAAGGTSNVSTWVVDDVQIGYGITDGVYYWSNGWSAETGIVPAGGGEAAFRWDDDGIYQTSSFRIYRSANPADMRGDASSTIVRTEPDTDAVSYGWTSSDGPAPGGLWCYQIYGYKLPCGESNQGEN